MDNIALESDPGGARTLDPMIKSHLLYQLSYGVILGAQRYNNFFSPSTLFSIFENDGGVYNNEIGEKSFCSAESL